VKVAIYARVSTERQEERGTIGSQLELLRTAANADGDDLVAEFVDDGYSGTRLDRPALDRLRDAAEAGALDAVLCLCPDRLARAYAYQVLILEELERFGVTVRFLDGQAPGDDPQAKLLVQVQGVIAEYERAKIAERYRRGKPRPRPRWRGVLLEGPLWLPARRPGAAAPGAHGDLRARGKPAMPWRSGFSRARSARCAVSSACSAAS
jgi:DNA invertase Pin-like site-specific DNA recombinase